MGERCLAGELGDDAHRELLAELDSPLIERVDVPDDALGEDGVLVEGDEHAEDVRSELLGHDRRRRPVAGEDAMGNEPVGRSLRGHLLGGLPERERLRLREQIGGEDVVMLAQRVERAMEADEVAWDQRRSLMDQLVEAVLAVRPRLAPVHRARVVVDLEAIERHALAVRLHRQLLEVRREAFQVLVVGQHGDGLGAEELPIPHRKEPHQRRQVSLQRRGPEVLVHGVEAGEQLAEPLRADGDHRRQADRRVHRIAPADPVPEAEHVGRVDAERRHLLRVRRNRDEVPRDCRLVAAEAAQEPCSGGACVGHRLESGEGLRRDDEQRLGGVEVAGRLGEVGAVDVGHEAHGQLARGVVP